MVKAGAEFCPDCGAPLPHDDAPSEGSDAAIYPELARANLLRMRGEYKQAEDICLSILRRYPNNATANSLLGDMKAEQGDLEQAAEWYELALDLVDDSSIKTKLSNVKKRVQEREAANTAKQIGLPSGKPKIGLYVLIVLILIGGSASVAYVLGSKASQGSAKRTKMNDPLVIPGNGSTNSSRDQGTDAEMPDSGQPTPTNSGMPDADRGLLQTISQASLVGSKAISALQDPRTKTIIVTFIGSEGEAMHELAAQLGKATLESHPDCLKVVLRGISGRQVAFIADMTRESLAATETQEWKDAHANDAKAWMSASLMNAWPASNQGTGGSDSSTPSERGDASGEPLQGN